MTTEGFPIIDFRQFGSETDDDRLLLFAAPAREIAKWAGIPQKGWHIRMLYQRWITPSRERSLVDFWNAAATPRDDQPKQYILGPTALTIAIHGTPRIKSDRIHLDYDSVLPMDEGGSSFWSSERHCWVTAHFDKNGNFMPPDWAE